MADNSTLSNFARSGHLDVLQAMIPQGVWVPARVVEEIQGGVQKYPSLRDLLALQGGWLKEIPPEEEPPFERIVQLQKRFRRIRKGADAWVIASAETLGTAVLSDDKGIRKACRVLEIPVLTTVQLLRQALRRKVISEQKARRILEDLYSRARFWLSWEDLRWEEV